MKKQLATCAMLFASLLFGAAIAALPGCQPSKPDSSRSAAPTPSTTTNGESAIEPLEDEPQEKPAEEPADKPADKPEADPADKPAEKPADKPAEKPADKPAEKPADKPAEKPADKPAEKPADKPAEKPADKPAEKPADKPAEKPADKPADQPKEKPAEPAKADGAAVTAAAAIALTSSEGQIKPGDWPQWGGTSHRNNTPMGRNIPVEWEVGRFDRKTGAWIKDDAVNIKYVSAVGSQTYGNPVVASGKVFVGTNNGAGYLPRYPNQVDLGCLLCFDEADGGFLWQHSSEKLATGRVHDWPLQGICCATAVEGDRLWFVTSRGEVRCLDVEGYYDGEDDGPVQNEWARVAKLPPAATGATVAALAKGELTDDLRAALAASQSEVNGDAGDFEASARKWKFSAKVGDKQRQFEARVEGPAVSVYRLTTVDDRQEADVVWVFNMMEELGSSQHNMCSCSVTLLGDILFVNTSNGLDESHINLPAVDAPSFFAMDKNTGEVYWTDKSPGANILHGQWSSPTVATFGGTPQAIFAGGDGWVYSFRADKGKDGKAELLWKFDANPKESKWILGGRGTRNNIIATPVVYEGRVYVAVGQDPEHGEGDGHLWCLDPNKRGDVSRDFVVKRDAPDKPVPPRRLQALNEEEGEVVVPNKNSAVIWHYSKFDQDGNGEIDFEEEMHRSCGTVAIKDDLLYIADFSGLFHCLDAKTGEVHWTYDMLAAAWGSPLIVDGHVYIGDEDGDVTVFNLTKEKHEPIAEINMSNSVYSTPIIANNVLFIANKTHLFAIEADKTSE